MYSSLLAFGITLPHNFNTANPDEQVHTRLFELIMEQTNNK